MKKIATTSLIAIAIVGSAFAAPEKKTIHCAVMSSNVVNIKDATAKHADADYKGHRYFFCCDGCPSEFKAHPAKYAKSESIPTPKTKSKKA
jgi:YHS domain-containing protein